MFASFYSNGTTPSFNDKLNTFASGILICSTVSISNFGGIPSTPGDLLSFIAFIFLATNSGVTTNGPVILYFQHCLLEVQPCLVRFVYS